MRKIVFCVARGKPEYAEMALGLARSLRLIGDATPRAILTDIESVEWSRYFDIVVRPTGPRSCLDKLTALDYLDADQVLSLDVDMLAFKRLDDIFAAAAGHPLAVQGYQEHEEMWHGRPVTDVIQRYDLPGVFPRFNGGLIYYERGDQWNQLLATARAAEADYESLGFATFRGGAASEEVCLLHAMLTVGPYHLLPMESQFQHSMAGAIGRLEIDILQNRCQGTCKTWKLEFAQPYLFHAWRYKDFRLYWDQLRALRIAEEKADLRPRDFLPRWKGLQRSIERRWIKNVRRYR